MEDKNSAIIRVHINFKRRLDDFIKEYKNVNGIKISYCDATKIIDYKLENAGGLVL